MNQRHFQNTSHLSENVNLMVENVTRDKNGTIILRASVSVKTKTSPM